MSSVAENAEVATAETISTIEQLKAANAILRDTTHALIRRFEEAACPDFAIIGRITTKVADIRRELVNICRSGAMFDPSAKGMEPIVYDGTQANALNGDPA